MCHGPWGCKELDTTEQLNWTEQYSGFCHPSTWMCVDIWHRYTQVYIWALPLEPPTLLPPLPAHPLCCYRVPAWVPRVCSKFPMTMHFTYVGVYASYFSFHWSHSLLPTSSFLPPPTPVHKSLLYVCVSTAALQIGSSVPSFWTPYTCINVWYLLFSFWLTSLCVKGSVFIHLISTNSEAFLVPLHFTWDWKPPVIRSKEWGK